MTNHELEYTGHEFVNFNDESYRWVDIKHFRLPADVPSDQETVALLLAHVRYRDSYLGADSHEHDSETLHGPHWLDRITVVSFELVDEQQALKTISDFAEPDADTSPEVIANLDRSVYSRIRSMPVRFGLRPSLDSARTE